MIAPVPAPNAGPTGPAVSQEARPAPAPAQALPVRADRFTPERPEHHWVHDADVATHARVAAAGAFASHIAVLAGGATLGGLAGSAVGGALGSAVGGLLGSALGVGGTLAGGALGLFLGGKLQFKTEIGRKLGGRLGAMIGDAVGRGGAALGVPVRSDHIEETKDFSYAKMVSHLGDMNYTSHPRISAAEADAFIAGLEPGDIVLTNDEAATIWSVGIGLVDGKGAFNHALLYQGDGRTLESRVVTHGVAEGDLKSVLEAKHFAVAIRPHYASPDEAAAVVGAARSMIGVPYDFKFRFGDDSLYCSEFVYKSVREGAPEVDFEKRFALGRVLVLPGDLLRTKDADVVSTVGRDHSLWDAYLAMFT